VIGQLVTFEDLKAATGYSRLSDIERCLQKAGIRYSYGKDGIWTTIDAVNAGLGLRPAENDGQYKPDQVI
jgi:hypothetical protein